MNKIQAQPLQVRQGRIGYLFIALPCLLLLVFQLAPIVISIGMSLTNYNVIDTPKFVGLANYQRLFSDEIFFTALKNTVLYTLLYVPLGLVVALGTALFLNANHRLAALFRTFFYLPILCSTVATATLWFWILNPQNGLLNAVLGLFGVPPQAWLYNTRLAMVSIIVMSVWAGFGTNMMIFLSGLKGVPQTLYEAARIDGANPWQSFWHITRPAISRTTFLVSTMLIIRAMQVFDEAFVLTQGGPGNATITLVYYIYNSGFKNLRFGYASAISFVVFLIILVFSIINIRLSDAGDVTE